MKIPSKIAGLLMILTCFSCHQNSDNTTQKDTSAPGNTESARQQDLVQQELLTYNPVFNQTAAFIAGVKEDSAGKNTYALDTTRAWRSFSNTFDSAWKSMEEKRLQPMKAWKQDELTGVNKEITSLFYPFSGPDYLTADVFFSKADTFRLIGLEPLGGLPDISKMKEKDMDVYLKSVKYSLDDLFKRSYFITLHMMEDLRKNKVNGTLPVICIFLKRTGHTITDVGYVGIDSLGREVPAVDTIPYAGTKGVKVSFVEKGSQHIKTLYYFKTDLSDAGLKKNKGFTAYLNKIGPQVTYLKAASHLLHYGSFTTIRNVILDKSFAVLQDDSGIAYRFFDKDEWNIKLYGKYMSAVKDFSGVNQKDLKEAYQKDSTIQTLPFSLGYHWGTSEVNLMLAVKKQP